MISPNPTSVVLVHGSFVDATSWEPVSELLKERVPRLEIVELHRGSLAADTAAVQAAVDATGGPVVLCGWSYGGMVITGVAPAPGSHLVYLCALIPDVGDTAISMGSRHPGGIDSLLAEDDEGDLVLRGELLDDILWADAPPELAARARATLRTQSMQTFLDSPERLAWKTTPSTLVIGRHDRVFGRGLIEETARRATTVLEWDTSHSPVLSRPDLVADLLVELATPSLTGTETGFVHWPVSDRKPPRLAAADDRRVLWALTQYHRDSVVRKLDGLGEDEARREFVPSGTTLLWIVKHLTVAELLWVGRRFAGRDIVLPSDAIDDDDTIHSEVVEDKWFAGGAELPRRLPLSRSGTTVRCVTEGFEPAPPPPGVHSKAFVAACEQLGIGADLLLTVPQAEVDGCPIDERDRVQIGADLIRHLIAAGL